MVVRPRHVGRGLTEEMEQFEPQPSLAAMDPPVIDGQDMSNTASSKRGRHISSITNRETRAISLDTVELPATDQGTGTPPRQRDTRKQKARNPLQGPYS